MSIKATTLLTAALFLLLAAILSPADQLFFMAAAMIAVAVVARVAVWVSLRGLQCRRVVSDRVFEDDVVSVTLSVSNPSWMPKFFLHLEDALSPWLESDNNQFLIPVLWPGQEVSLEYQARATKRGWLQVGPLSITSSDPIGLFFRGIDLPKTSVAIVYPRPFELPPYDLEGAVTFSGGISERMARAGEGMDYHGVRDFHPGDELRRIHWKATARHQRLSVIEFQQSHAADVVIALDLLKGTNVGEGKQTTLEYAVKIAASIAHRAMDNGSIVALGMHRKDGIQTAVCRRDEEFQCALELLAAAEDEGNVPVYALLEMMKPLLTPGVAAIVVTADPNSRLPAFADYLQAENISLTAVLMNSLAFTDHPEQKSEVNPYIATAEHLRQVGANAYVIDREVDLTDITRHIISGAEQQK